MGEGGRGRWGNGEMGRGENGGGGNGGGGNEGWERGGREEIMMGENLRLRQGEMLPSVIFPLEQKFESFSDRGNGSQATHIPDLTQTTHEVMASVLSKWSSSSRLGGEMRHLRK